MKQNLSLHGLRGLLSFSLFVFHVANSGLPTFSSQIYAPFDFLFHSFEHGVELFFGISGIVILSAFEKSKNISSFIINRATRIWPVLWICVFAILFLSHFQTDKQIDTSLLTIAVNLLCLTPLISLPLIHPAAWTLCYEFIFYFAFVLYSIPRMNKKLKLALVSVFGLCFLIWMPRSWCFLAGVLIYVYRDKFKTEWRIFNYAGIFGLLSLLTWHSLNLLMKNNGTDINASLLKFAEVDYAILIQFAAFIFAFISLVGVFMERGVLSKILLPRPMQFLGTISYSLYLWQTIVMAIVKQGMKMTGIPNFAGEWSQIIFFVIALPPTLIVSYFSQRLIEDKLTNYFRHIARIRPHKVMQA